MVMTDYQYQNEFAVFVDEPYDLDLVSSFGQVVVRPNERIAAYDTMRKTYSAVRGFQTWLLCLPTKEERPIQDISPTELDDYLATFFTEIKTRDGGEYHPSSFNSLRSCLERHLQDLSLLLDTIPDDLLPPRRSSRQAAEKARIFLSQMVSDESENEDDQKNEADEEKSEDSQLEEPFAEGVTVSDKVTELVESEDPTTDGLSATKDITVDNKESDLTTEKAMVTPEEESADTKTTAVEQAENNEGSVPAPVDQPPTVTPPGKKRGRPPKARQTLIKLPPPKPTSSKKSVTDDKGTQAVLSDPQLTELVEETVDMQATNPVKKRKGKKGRPFTVKKKKGPLQVTSTDNVDEKIPVKRGRKPKGSVVVASLSDTMESSEQSETVTSETPETTLEGPLTGLNEQVGELSPEKPKPESQTEKPQKLKKGKSFKKKKGGSVTVTTIDNNDTPPKLDRVDTPTFQIENVRTVTGSPSRENKNGSPIASGGSTKGYHDQLTIRPTTTSSMMPPKIDLMTTSLQSAENSKASSHDIIVKQERTDLNDFSPESAKTPSQLVAGSLGSLRQSPIATPGPHLRGAYSPGNTMTQSQQVTDSHDAYFRQSPAATESKRTNLRPQTPPISNVLQILSTQHTHFNPANPLIQRARHPGSQTQMIRSPPSTPPRMTLPNQRFPAQALSSSQQMTRHQYTGHFSSQTTRMQQTMNKYSPSSQTTRVSHPSNIAQLSSPRMAQSMTRFPSAATPQAMSQAARFSTPRTTQPAQRMSSPQGLFRTTQHPTQQGQFSPPRNPQTMHQVSVSPSRYNPTSVNQVSQSGRPMPRMASPMQRMPSYSQAGQLPTGRATQSTNRFSSPTSHPSQVTTFRPSGPSPASAPRMSQVRSRLSSPTQVVPPRQLQSRQTSSGRGAPFPSQSPQNIPLQVGRIGSPRMPQVRHQLTPPQPGQISRPQLSTASQIPPLRLISQTNQPLQSAPTQMSAIGQTKVTAAIKPVVVTPNIVVGQVSQSSTYEGKAGQELEVLSSNIDQGKVTQTSSQDTAPSQSSSSVEISAHIRKEMSMFRMLISKHVRTEVSDDPSALVKILALYRSLSNQPKDKNLFSDQEVDVLTRINSDLFPTPTSFLEGVIMQMVANFSSCILTWTDHMALLWGDVELVTEANQEYILYTGKCSKPTAPISMTRARERKAYQRPDSPGRCPVILYKEYLRLRPAEANTPMSHFYLTPNRDFVEAFSSRALEDKSFSLLAALVKGKAKRVLNPANVVEIND